MVYSEPREVSTSREEIGEKKIPVDSSTRNRSVFDEKTQKGIVSLVIPFKGKGEARIVFPEELSKQEVGKLIMLLKTYVSEDEKEKT